MRRKNEQIKKVLKNIFVFTLIFSWIFSGWPQVLDFPSEIEKVLAADTGVKTAGTATNTSWTSGWDTSSLSGDDTSIAIYSSVGTAVGTLSSFALGVPAGASSIDGIKVEIEAQEGHTLCNGYLNTYLSWDNESTYTAAKRSPDSGALATGFTLYTEGDATDTWGRTWSVSEFSDANFKVKIEGTNAKAGKNVEIDYVWVTIYYTIITTTLGDGTDPSPSTVAPGSADNYLNQFSFVTSSGTDTVTALTVTTANTTAVASVEIWNDAMSTQYYSTDSTPNGNAWEFSSGTEIPVTTSSANFRVIFDAKSHASLAGGTYGVTGTVTAYTCANSQAGSDTDSPTITVDNSPPSDATWGTITPGNAQIELNWTNPGADFYRVLILRNTSAVTDTPTEGTEYTAGQTIGSSTVRYANSAETFTDNSGLSNGTDYYYKIFAYDSYINYASGTSTGPYTPTDAAATLSFSITNNDIGFGTWSGTEKRWATADKNGATESEPAHASLTQLVASTNSSSGLTITIKSQGSGSSAGLYRALTPAKLIPAVASSAVSANSEEYGVYGTNASLLTIDEGFDNDSVSDEAISTSALTFAYATGAVDSGAVDVALMAAVTALTPAGTYNDTLTLICTGTF